ncbi:MAG: ABC transporter ATP-binding protein [Planctomycetota bacterium]
MKKTKNLAAFKRIWSYVWPQWPRLTALLFWTFVIAFMFSVSFATIIPLLKVMMGEEGLHGWVDRKVVNWRYGMDFTIPDMSSVLEADADPQITSRLLIVKVKQDGWADRAGLKVHDRIIGAGSSMPTDEAPVSMVKLLEELATVEADTSIPIRYTRANELENMFNIDSIVPVSPDKPAYIDYAQWPVSFLPRGESTNNKMRGVIIIILGMGVVTILRCTGRFYQTYLADKIVFIAVTHLREDIFTHTMYMPVGFFSSKGTSDTTSRILGDVASCGKGVKVLLGKTLREPLKAIGLLVCALLVSWQLTLIFLAAAPLTIGMFAVLGKKIKKATKKSLVSNAEMLNRIQGAMSALRVVKVYNRQDHEIAQYHATNRTLLKRLLKVARIDRMANPLMEVLGMIAGSAALIVGAVWVTNSQMSASSFFGLLIFLGSAAESVRKVSNVWNQVQSSNAAAERVFEVLDEPAEKEEPDAFDLQPLRNNIKFNEIVFTYPGAAAATLNGLDLFVEAGQTVAVVGPNGSGKSTLVNLIPRFYDPDSGTICFDGQDIHQATLKSLRSQISMVTQNVITFNDTIASNIAYGKPGATDDEIIAAAKRAFAHEFIEPLPDGYNTFIGENSAGFSGGQLQRIVIARAILKNPQILIFDEAMSQIDADSEMKIHNALSELMKGRTCFLIAHRFSTVISADSIVVIDNGRIAAQGTHGELIKTCDVYKRLYETQLIGT